MRLQQKQMYHIIDFRNGRYQGQTKDQLPHGLGCFLDRNFMFCIAEWTAGEINGSTILIFPSGRIFCGKVSYRTMEGTCLFELAEDHVQVLTFQKSKRQARQMEKIAAVLPLMKVVLEIDNSNQDNARVLNEFAYSDGDQEENLKTIAKILNLERASIKNLYTHRTFLQFFEDNFFRPYPNIFEYLITDSKGKKQYFLGLKGQGLGVKIQPNEQLTLAKKKTGRVYFVRGMGSFTKQNQMKDIGMKMKDNSMKGVIYEQGNYAVSDTLITYEAGRRPVNCSINFHNYIKRSLYYRDKVLSTDYLYGFEGFVYGFNENLRKIETQKVAQITIQNPNDDAPILSQIQRKRREREKGVSLQYKAKETIIQPERVNPYRPEGNRTANPAYNLNIARQQIYSTLSKKKYLPSQSWEDYKNIEYVDPNYRKAERNHDFVAVRQQLGRRDAQKQRRWGFPDGYNRRVRDIADYEEHYQEYDERLAYNREHGRRHQESREYKYPDSLYPTWTQQRRQYRQAHYEDRGRQTGNGYRAKNRTIESYY